MRAHLLLADSTQVDAGSSKVHALGLGWSTTASPLPPAALIVLIKVPWNQANRQHRLQLTLVDEDGRPVMGQDSVGDPAPLFIEQQFEVGRPPGVPAGFDLDHSLAINFGPGMPLQAGHIYEWRLQIDGHHDEAWTARFFVRP